MAAEVRRLVVAERRQVAQDVVSLALRDPAGGELPAWTPGAHLDLVLGEQVVRQYSLCGDPAEPGAWRLAVLREVSGRGGSNAVHERLHPGSEVEVRGPRNAFALEPAPAYVFVAGGIGITPILPMAREAHRRGVPFRLAYGGRTLGSMAFVDEVLALGEAGGADVAVHPLDTDGLLPVGALVDWARRQDADVYCCGPGPLLDAVLEAGEVLGPGRVHVERFRPAAAAPGAGTAAGAPPGAGTDAAFELEVRPQGLTVTVPAGRSALEVLEEAGVPILSSCREGTCGTCEVSVLSGAVDHRDHLLTAEERAAGDTMFVCVSRAAGSRLVVEV